MKVTKDFSSYLHFYDYILIKDNKIKRVPTEIFVNINKSAFTNSYTMKDLRVKFSLYLIIRPLRTK